VITISMFSIIYVSVPANPKTLKMPIPKSEHRKVQDRLEQTNMGEKKDTKTKLSVINIEECNCNRDSSSYHEPDTPRSANTCSSHSHRRGSGQKVVAFSYYEHDAKMSRKRIRTGEIKESHFIEGILINIQRLQEYYPEFVIRLYHNTSLDDPLMLRLCELACQYSFLDLCRVDPEMGDVFPMLWRFFPTLDPGVDVVMSRDLDSSRDERSSLARGPHHGRGLGLQAGHQGETAEVGGQLEEDERGPEGARQRRHGQGG